MRFSVILKCSKKFTSQKRGFAKRKISVPYTKVGSHQTKITAQLWVKRKEEDQLLNPKNSAKYAQTKITERTPNISFTEYPFGDDLELQEQYLNPYGNIRMGRIFEDMDAMAGNVAFKHADDEDPTTVPLKIVTASVDRIHLREIIGVNKNLVMQGFVRWVGSSSMEIDVNIFQEGDRKKLLNSRFIMVAIDALTNKTTKINPLKLETEKDVQRFEVGIKNAALRKTERKSSLAKIPPLEEEVLLLHDLFLNAEKFKRKKDTMVHIIKTKNKSMMICQPTERNLHNTIFGGFLMRQGYLLAFATALTFLKRTPTFKSLEKINFIKAVNIGDLLKLSSTVVYVQDQILHVDVVIRVMDPEDGTEEITNEFHFTFQSNNGQNQSSCIQEKKVFPQYYVEGLRYIAARRRHPQLVKSIKNKDF